MSPQFCHWPQDGISQMEIPLRLNSSSAPSRSQATVLKQALKASKSSCKASTLFCWFDRFGHPELRWAFRCQRVTLSYLFWFIYLLVHLVQYYIYDLPETVVAAWFHFSPMDLKPCFRWRACCAASSFLCPSRASTAMPSVQGCRDAWHLSTFWTLRSCNASRFTTLTTLRSCTSLTLKPHDPLKLGPRIQASSLGTKSAPMCHNVIRKKYNLQFKKDIQFSITIISKLCYGCNKSCADRCDPLHLWLGLPSLHVSTSQLKHSAGISVLRDCWDSCGSNSKHIISMISIISILVLLERVNNSVLTATVVSLPFRDIDVGRFEGQRFIILYLRRPLTARTALLAGVRARSCEKASRPVAAWNKIWFSWAVLFLHWHQAYTSASACLCRMERLLTPEFS